MTKDMWLALAVPVLLLVGLVGYSLGRAEHPVVVKYRPVTVERCADAAAGEFGEWLGEIRAEYDARAER